MTVPANDSRPGSDGLIGMALTPVAKVRRGVHLALAVFVGGTRLIDNTRL